jgi:hypothetical protein
MERRCEKGGESGRGCGIEAGCAAAALADNEESK